MQFDDLEYLYHATEAEHLGDILQYGLKPGTYLGAEEIADYYAEDIEDNGNDFAVLEINFEAIKELSLAPDMAGVEEPLTFTLKSSEEAIWEAWEATEGSWQDCFRLIGSLRCMDTIPPEAITVVRKPDMGGTAAAP